MRHLKPIIFEKLSNYIPKSGKKSKFLAKIHRTVSLYGKFARDYLKKGKDI
jgi:hypothetical protein